MLRYDTTLRLLTPAKEENVLETAGEIEQLQRMLSSSMGRAGTFLRSSLEIPEKSLNAKQVARRLHGALTVTLATVTSTAQPRVAPVLAFFWHGAFHVPTVSNALRARHVRANPGVSLSCYEGNDFAVIVHGTGHEIDATHTSFMDLVKLQEEFTGEDVREWGDAIYLRVEATHFYTFARYPAQFPE